MLAVKHIQLSGHEDIYLTNRVSYQPGDGSTCIPPSLPMLWLERADGSTFAIHGGTIFVMNDLGKTVARYDIGASIVLVETHAPVTVLAA